jgi:predicted TIM-barrel fold metal-dependent hydrolase
MRTLITSDSHLVPPPWLLDELPARLQDKVTGQLMRYEKRADGNYIVFPHVRAEAMANAGMPGEFKIEDDAMLAKVTHFAFEVDAQPGFGPEQRLLEMARENVVGSVLIGNPIFGLQRGPEQVEAQVAFCQVVNDWLADTYKSHLGQFAPGIYLPYLDPAACVTELERAAAMGLRPALMPDGIWDSPYWKPEWEQFWEAAAGLRIPVTLHIAAIRERHLAERGLPNVQYAGESIEEFYGLSCDMGKTLVELTFGGIFQKYPDLRVVMTEGYAFWLAGLMEFCDHHWQGRFGKRARASVELEELPSAYMKRQAYATFMWDPVAIRNRDLTGVDCLLWGNDYPHPEGIFPDSQMWVEKQFAGVPEDEVDRMTYSTAKALFGFDG